ncbi:unnamed protein product [Vitrella brassicaformis CCMP3155]|uniref:Uncharacterized protein n=1 Tax=Vitrella brassicaformis (strain CCMP3155) TaxID=1169540 RepID=A0A0G4EK50_VITBC|nr:unnamed protein product [Vitrella brassicaformis CCMP3155]|eukprot:CEL97815.1 unnamed protein product [Vitrella brassicaformis CCMP3155]
MPSWDQLRTRLLDSLRHKVATDSSGAKPPAQPAPGAPPLFFTDLSDARQRLLVRQTYAEMRREHPDVYGEFVQGLREIVDRHLLDDLQRYALKAGEGDGQGQGGIMAADTVDGKCLSKADQAEYLIRRAALGVSHLLTATVSPDLDRPVLLQLVAQRIPNDLRRPLWETHLVDAKGRKEYEENDRHRMAISPNDLRILEKLNTLVSAHLPAFQPRWVVTAKSLASYVDALGRMGPLQRYHLYAALTIVEVYQSRVDEVPYLVERYLAALQHFAPLTRHLPPSPVFSSLRELRARGLDMWGGGRSRQSSEVSSRQSFMAVQRLRSNSRDINGGGEGGMVMMALNGDLKQPLKDVLAACHDVIREHSEALLVQLLRTRGDSSDNGGQAAPVLEQTSDGSSAAQQRADEDRDWLVHRCLSYLLLPFWSALWCGNGLPIDTTKYIWDVFILAGQAVLLKALSRVSAAFLLAHQEAIQEHLDEAEDIVVIPDENLDDAQAMGPPPLLKSLGTFLKLSAPRISPRRMQAALYPLLADMHLVDVPLPQPQPQPHKRPSVAPIHISKAPPPTDQPAPAQVADSLVYSKSELTDRSMVSGSSSSIASELIVRAEGDKAAPEAEAEGEADDAMSVLVDALEGGRDRDSTTRRHTMPPSEKPPKPPPPPPHGPARSASVGDKPHKQEGPRLEGEEASPARPDEMQQQKQEQQEGGGDDTTPVGQHGGGDVEATVEPPKEPQDEGEAQPEAAPEQPAEQEPTQEKEKEGEGASDDGAAPPPEEPPSPKSPKSPRSKGASCCPLS